LIYPHPVPNAIALVPTSPVNGRGDEFISAERIRQIESNAMKKLKTSMLEMQAA